MLIVCLARDELLERRPTWGGGRRNATTISLDPLSGEETEELVRSLLAGQERGGELAEKVADRSGGNPLFAEEMVNRLREEASDDVDELPDSVHSVLAARLDALEPDERRLLQAASVIGQGFWDKVAGELAGGRSVDRSLTALVDKDLLTPSTASRVVGEREFTFKHALVRDVAYATLPRAVRARQHFALAGIIESRLGANREGVAALLAEHHGRAAALAEQAGFPAEELQRMRVGSAQASAGCRRAGGGAVFQRRGSRSLRERLAGCRRVFRRTNGLGSRSPGGMRRFAREGSMPRSQAGREALDYQRGVDDRTRAAELHRKIGSGLWHKADRELRSPTSNRGSTCSRTAIRAGS